jgi:hypothetical protein
MRGRYLVVAIVAVIVAAAVPASAGMVSDNFTGKFAKKADKGAGMGLHAVYKHGKIVRVDNLDWDGFLCVKGHEGFTGGVAGKPFAVRNGEFHGKRSVAAKATPQVTAKVTGEFVSKKKVKGTITLGASCNWTDRFTATKGR